MKEIHQWQLLLIHFGDYLDLFEDDKIYKKSDFKNGIHNQLPRAQTKNLLSPYIII